MAEQLAYWVDPDFWRKGNIMFFLESYQQSLITTHVGGQSWNSEPFHGVLVLFPQSNFLKNRQELEYSLIGTKFPTKISLRILYTVKKYFFLSVHVIKAWIDFSQFDVKIDFWTYFWQWKKQVLFIFIVESLAWLVEIMRMINILKIELKIFIIVHFRTFFVQM
jgi:hypothetical protein